MTKHQQVICPGWPRGSCSATIWRSRRLCDACKYARRDPVTRFWRGVEKGDGCWEWTKSRSRLGYGTFSLNRRKWVSAHRFAWTLTNGPIPDGLCVLHRCDNPPCVRADHLFLGTLRDNQQDMYAKGRARDRWGRPKQRRAPRLRPNAKSRLTPDEVAAIRNRPKKHGSLRAVAKELGIGYMRAWFVASGRTYRDVEP